MIDDAGIIADALIVGSPDEKNPHWNESARLFLTTAILHIATHPNYIGKRHLVSVYQFLMKLNDALEDENRSNQRLSFASRNQDGDLLGFGYGSS